MLYHFQLCMLSHFNHAQLFVTLWTIACQAPLSMGFPRQEYWSGLPFPSPGELPNPGIKPTSLTSPELAGRFFLTTSANWEVLFNPRLLISHSVVWENNSNCFMHFNLCPVKTLIDKEFSKLEW